MHAPRARRLHSGLPAAPRPLLGPSLVLRHLVGEGVHLVRLGEDVVEVGEDVVGRECDELASTPKHLAEETVSVEGVGEGDDEADDEAVVSVVVLLQTEHVRRARREVAVAGREEEAG